MTEGHRVPVSEVERHREQTEPENIPEVRRANDPLQIASYNVLIAPQIFAYGIHAGTNRFYGAPRQPMQLILFILNARFSQATGVVQFGEGPASSDCVKTPPMVREPHHERLWSQQD